MVIFDIFLGGSFLVQRPGLSGRQNGFDKIVNDF